MSELFWLGVLLLGSQFYFNCRYLAFHKRNERFNQALDAHFDRIHNCEKMLLHVEARVRKLEPLEGRDG